MSSQKIMNRFDLHTSAWYEAITLSERIQLLKNINHPNKNLTLEVKQLEKANKKIERWQSYPWFSERDYFRQRLEIEGITEEELQNILAESIESVQQSYLTKPIWLEKIEHIFKNHCNYNSFPLLDDSITENIKSFLTIIRPLINYYLHLLDQQIIKISNHQKELPFAPETIADLLFIYLPKKLLRIITKTLVLELNVARLQNKLVGDTPEKRFQSFIEYLSEPEQLISLLKEYPVMARQLIVTLENWLDFSKEFIHHLCADFSEIKQLFTCQTIGKLIKLDHSGDSHKSNRTVLILTFSCGLKIVYKPKSLTVDCHFQELLTWLNSFNQFLPFKTLKIINRHNYGWVEFIAHKPCNSIAEVKNFYTRQGGYLALLYLLNASDFHYENLIATGEDPFLIDLETLFHPHLGNFQFDQATKLASLLYLNSVLSVGLLPIPVWSNNQSQGIDLSGLGTMGTQLTPHKLPYWDGIGTDEMKLQKQQMEIVGDQHRPRINDQEINVLDYQNEILTGFTIIYQLLLEHKDEFHRHLLKFAHDQIRVVIRHTQEYGLLLQDSFHPDFLRDAIARDQLFDKLWGAVKHLPYLAQTISAECQDLQNGDIPFFSTSPNSRDLFTSRGERIPNVLSESSLDSVENSLKQMGEKDLKRQIWYIKASLATLAVKGNEYQKPSYRLRETEFVTDKEQLVTLAEKIAGELDDLAIRGKNDLTWISLTAIDENRYSLVPSGLDLYGGLSGITLFFAYLAQVTGKQRYLELAQGSFNSMQEIIPTAKQNFPLIGGFSGWGGVIYTLTHLASLWQRQDLLDEAEKIVELLPDLIEQDDQFDLIGGSAGCIVSLITLYRSQPSASILQVAKQCAEHLINNAQKMPEGIGWLLKNQVNALTGFSHGNAGIAWALLQLAELTGDVKLKETALEAIVYERSLFVPYMHNWADLRNLEKRVLKQDVNLSHVDCHNAWCHGAPGIGLARFASLDYIDDAHMRSEIDIALKTTINQGFGHNHSLCHGDLGNLELLLQAILRLDHSHWQPQVDRFTGMIVESIHNYGWLCGVPLQLETPGLMTGIAGIGYQLLRLAQPELVPSILLLETPKVSS
jgi:type 2 lantibiotic biosynthesis protein LanM